MNCRTVKSKYDMACSVKKKENQQLHKPRLSIQYIIKYE